jgi:hypothetical protein
MKRIMGMGGTKILTYVEQKKIELMENYTWKKIPKWNQYLRMETKQTLSRTCVRTK